MYTKFIRILNIYKIYLKLYIKIYKYKKKKNWGIMALCPYLCPYESPPLQMPIYKKNSTIYHILFYQ